MRFLLATAMILATAAPAFAEDEVVNTGVIRQIAESESAMALSQVQSVGGIQAINLVGAKGRVINSGLIEQKARAASMKLEQRQSVGAVQAINVVYAGR